MAEYVRRKNAGEEHLDRPLKDVVAIMNERASAVLTQSNLAAVGRRSDPVLLPAPDGTSVCLNRENKFKWLALTQGTHYDLKVDQHLVNRDPFFMFLA